MCILRHDQSQAAVRELVKAIPDTTGNLPPLSAPAEMVLSLERPPSPGSLRVVAAGRKEDPA